MSVVEPASIEKAAAQLRQASASSTTCGPVRDLVGTATDIDAGYAIQQINTDRDIAAGRRVSGRKIGVSDGIEVPANRLLQPRAEAEVALVLEHDLDKGEHSFTDIISATAFALPSIEVVDSRIATGISASSTPLQTTRAAGSTYSAGARYRSAPSTFEPFQCR